jgi:hypothetical protein
VFDMTATYADACTGKEVVSHLHDLPGTVTG